MYLRFVIFIVVLVGLILAITQNASKERDRFQDKDIAIKSLPSPVSEPAFVSPQFLATSAPVPDSQIAQTSQQQAGPQSSGPFREAPKKPLKPDGNVIEFKLVDGYAVAYGDILLGKPDAGFNASSGYFEAPNPQLWEKPTIPYVIAPNLPNPKRVLDALEYFKTHTAIQFVPFQNERDAIVFEVGKEHCLSSLGKQGGLQPIKLSSGCGTPEIIHEIMHALGFVHEQSRPDRDQFIEILWDNISEPYKNQFAQVPETFTETIRDSSFDYQSIMLYRPDAFALKAGTPTMKSLGKETIAPTPTGLSAGDLKRLNKLYRFHE